MNNLGNSRNRTAEQVRELELQLALLNQEQRQRQLFRASSPLAASRIGAGLSTLSGNPRFEALLLLRHQEELQRAVEQRRQLELSRALAVAQLGGEPNLDSLLARRELLLSTRNQPIISQNAATDELLLNDSLIRAQILRWGAQDLQNQTTGSSLSLQALLPLSGGHMATSDVPGWFGVAPGAILDFATTSATQYPTPGALMRSSIQSEFGGVLDPILSIAGGVAGLTRSDPRSLFMPPNDATIDQGSSSSPTPNAQLHLKKKRPYNHESFPEKLYRMMEDMESEGRTDVISFSPSGTSLFIHRAETLSAEVLPRFFRHSSIASFKRQMRMYGFRKISQGPDEGAFSHKFFIKGRPDLAKQIRRTNDYETVPT